MAHRLGVIADDFTGATDIAGFMVENGWRVTQLIGHGPADVPAEVDAVVISLKSRSCPAEQAVADSLAALARLQDLGCDRFFFKYCSTFDSTAEGNIGPVTDALLAALDQEFTVICPALPVNGRTVCHGNLFVNGVPLNESGMKDHPITPMKDANLLRLMAAQAKGLPGLVDYQVVLAGADAVKAKLTALTADGVNYAVLDTLTMSDLTVLGEAVSDLPLVTGGSGLGAGLACYTTAGQGAKHARALGAPAAAGRALVLSGSCSLMTNAQVAAYQQQAPHRQVEVASCLEDPQAYAIELADWVLDQPASPAPMLYATQAPEQLAQIQARYGVARASEAVEGVFARVAARLAEQGFTKFIVAGGETSGIVTQALGVSGFNIGPQIAPGVPWVRALDKPLSLALKSGNFGDEQFFAKAQEFYHD
ncbi:3-oxo-tetronate kinase [Zobellella maritima]|uniref:3-oxo-tetronate kinase n=1 Tax=Zobellella maritima TaxID=2059725 RepID=UPI0018E51AFB|nr:3-oxo-tetronate kinase [Zobellella maritima]